MELLLLLFFIFHLLSHIHTHLYALVSSSCRYNDISPLENHHCSIAFRLLEHPECNIFRNMSKEMYK